MEEVWMRRALDLAERGRGWVEPNPLVFRVGLHQFRDLTTTGHLVDALRLERNRFFHSGI